MTHRTLTVIMGTLALTVSMLCMFLAERPSKASSHFPSGKSRKA